MLLRQFKKLDPEFKARWTAALRSEKYEQGQGRLKLGTEDANGTVKCRLCCLGVASEVAEWKMHIFRVPFWSGRDGATLSYILPELANDMSKMSVERGRNDTLTDWAREAIGLDEGAMCLLWRFNDGYSLVAGTMLKDDVTGELHLAEEFVMHRSHLPRPGRQHTFQEIAAWIDMYL